MSNYRLYQKKVEALQDILRHCNDNDIALSKTSSNLFRLRNHDAKIKLDVRNFNSVIQIDTNNLTADVEGMLTYEDFVEKTLQQKLLPTVVPELKSITVGGAYVGGGIESSSFRYGLVHETILEVDVLLSNGDLITATPENEHRDLFYALPNSYATFGYVLRLKVKLIPTKPYVRMSYHKYSNSDDLFFDMKKYCLENRKQGRFSYIDGVVFDKNELYLCLAEFVDQAPYLSCYTYMNIYYRSIQSRTEDYLTIKDYIWRWDADWFWCSNNFFLQNKFLRLILGKFMLRSTTYWKIRRFFNKHVYLSKLLLPNREKVETVIQDVQLPIEKCTEFLDFFRKSIGIKPIWLCPTMPYQQEVVFSLYPMPQEQLFVNFGFWDGINSDKPKGYYNRLLEKTLPTLGGFKSLYSDSYYSESEFWSLHDKLTYSKLKQKYDPSNRLSDLFHKTVNK